MRYHITTALMLTGVLAAEAHAQAPAGGEFQVNTYTTGMQGMWTGPRVAADAAGNFVVVWTSPGQDGDGHGVFGQRYDASGTPRGAEFQVNTYTTGDQGGNFNPEYHYRSVAIASDVAGNTVVVWPGSGQDGSGDGVFGQRYDAAGAPRGSEFRVNTYTTDDQTSPSVASDAGGNFVVVWKSGRLFSYPRVLAQRYEASGAPRGGEFQVNTSFPCNPSAGCGDAAPPAVASDGVGDFVVVWEGLGDAGPGIFAQRYDAAGVPWGSEFQASSHGSDPRFPVVASDAAGGSVVAWSELYQGWEHILARRYDASGAPLGAEFMVTSSVSNLLWSWLTSVASDAAGNFIVAWAAGWPSRDGVFARRWDASGAPLGSEFQVNRDAGPRSAPSVASSAAGDFVVASMSWVLGDAGDVFAQRYGNLQPSGLAVDPSGSGSSDGNGVLEPGESVAVKPSFRNVNGVSQTATFDGVASSFSGPSASGVSYQLLDGAASYGPIANGATASCTDCYQVGVTFGGVRPARHWDATLVEDLSLDPPGQRMTRSLHLGESFNDVPKTSGYYRFVETLLHKGVTGGCSATSYCPSSSVTREQVAVFAVVGKDGPGYRPFDCSPGNEVFADVPASSPFCSWIQELSRRGVVSGCGGGNYCPSDPVSREQMPVFMLKTLDSAISPPPCTTPMFADVPASSPYCRWIQELARRGVVSGCGGGNYCPSDPVTREQMAVFVSQTFGLSLYGP